MFSDICRQSVVDERMTPGIGCERPKGGCGKDDLSTEMIAVFSAELAVNFLRSSRHRHRGPGDIEGERFRAVHRACQEIDDLARVPTVAAGG